MANNKTAAFAWWCAATIFLSAFLLFQVQPIISKMILPWFGGGPAVWTACMLFFQVTLLGGYAYAHFIERLPSPSWRMGVHITLIVVAALTLPITPHASWKPVDGTQPTWRILTLLAGNVGLPYFVLASTGPLVQAWFSRLVPNRSPYRLYALSNVGSLGALLTYPFFFEPLLTTSWQGGIWSAAFAIFALLCGSLAWATFRTGRQPSGAMAEPDENERSPSHVVEIPSLADTPVPDSLAESGAAADFAPSDPPSLDRRLAWLLLPALASMMLLAITNHVCQDVAVVPFFWVAPLGLYLLTFIICFDNAIWYRRRIFSLVTIIAVLLLAITELESQLEELLAKFNIDFNISDFTGELLVTGATNLEALLARVNIIIPISDYTGDLIIDAAAYLSVLFLICMVCHGELVRCKPPARWLTSFYLMVSAGGALGGIFVALICPQVFSTHLELGIGLVATFMVAMGVVWDEFWTIWPVRHMWGKGVSFAGGFLLLLVVVRAQFENLNSDALFSIRNFYGVLTIEEMYEDDADYHIRRLLNGRILHGSQFLSPDQNKVATTYYNSDSGIGMAITHLVTRDPLRVAVVGLGTGTIASYSRPGESYTYYEINPNVVQLANEYFTFLSDSDAEVNILLGDARISMERQTPQQYDIIALDAFSGDAIPAHLLTIEAFEEYLRHLKPDGIIAVHISNRHLDLTPVVGGISEQLKVPAIKIEWNEDDHVGEAASDWVLLTNNDVFLEMPEIAAVAEPLEGSYKPIPLWTDQYSNLFQILQ
ncbi:MAG: fused MFS/spermidine synthase [Pirellulaceae bacterium]|nr:fused MFS/spermidine synthase [Pirellulaceae bacterium]